MNDNPLTQLGQTAAEAMENIEANLPALAAAGHTADDIDPGHLRQMLTQEPEDPSRWVRLYRKDEG